MIIGYLDTSGCGLDTDEQKEIINGYAQTNGLKISTFYLYDDVRKVAESVSGTGHKLLFADISGLGATLPQITDNLKFLIDSHFEVISISEDICLSSNSDSLHLLKGLELSINIRKSLVSTTTKKALNERRAQGHRLGREIGSKNKHYVWEGKEAEIKQKLSLGLSQKKIAADIGISIISLRTYLRKATETSPQNEARSIY